MPGLVALVMTLTGALLTALVVAREWERGTMEAILVTPLRAGEFLVAKIVPYYAARHGRHGCWRWAWACSCSTCRCAARCWGCSR